MSKLRTIPPVQILYQLSDVFDAVEERIATLEAELEEINAEGSDFNLMRTVTQSELGRRQEISQKLVEWKDNQVEILETDMAICEASIPQYMPNASLYEQIKTGKLKPVI